MMACLSNHNLRALLIADRNESPPRVENNGTVDDESSEDANYVASTDEDDSADEDGLYCDHESRGL